MMIIAVTVVFFFFFEKAGSVYAQAEVVCLVNMSAAAFQFCSVLFCSCPAEAAREQKSNAVHLHSVLASTGPGNLRCCSA